MSSGKWIITALLALVWVNGWLTVCTAQSALSITGTGQELVPLLSGDTAAGELSGIAYMGDALFYAVSDKSPDLLYTIKADIDPLTGQITGVPRVIDVNILVYPTATLFETIDLEDVVYDPIGNAIWTTDEGGSSPIIRQHDLSTMSGFNLVTSIDYTRDEGLSVFNPSNVRGNLSWESLTLQFNPAGDLNSLWTTTEQALISDGPTSTTDQGTPVRLTRITPSGATLGQWVYTTDSWRDLPPSSGFETSGVSDLLILPDRNHTLLVLERELDIQIASGPLSVLPNFRIRIYAVDFTDATDVSNLPQLQGETWQAVAKSRLWEGTFTTGNLEGMTLGQGLTNGDHSLILISDDQGFLMSQNLLALRLSGLDMEAETIPPLD